MIICLIHVAKSFNQELRQVHIKIAASVTMAEIETNIISLFNNRPHIRWPDDPDVPTAPLEGTHLAKIMTW